MRRDAVLGLERISTAPAWAMASVRIEAGSTGTPPGPGDEVALVGGDVLERRRRAVLLQLQDAVHEQERIAVRAGSLDVLDLERQLQRRRSCAQRVYNALREAARTRVLACRVPATSGVEDRPAAARRAPGRAAAHRGRDQRGPRPRRAPARHRARSCGGSSTTGSSTSSCPSRTARWCPRLRRGLRARAAARASGCGRARASWARPPQRARPCSSPT